MELEKAIKYLDMIKNEHNLDLLGYVYRKEAIETLINYIKEESIPRAVVEDKIKAKIEEVKDGTFDAKIVLQSLLEKE